MNVAIKTPISPHHHLHLLQQMGITLYGHHQPLNASYTSQIIFPLTHQRSPRGYIMLPAADTIHDPYLQDIILSLGIHCEQSSRTWQQITLLPQHILMIYGQHAAGQLIAHDLLIDATHPQLFSLSPHHGMVLYLPQPLEFSCVEDKLELWKKLQTARTCLDAIEEKWS